MINAKELRNISDANNTDSKTLKEIEKLIKQAATDGEYYIEYYGSISENCMEKLGELGYEINNIYQSYGDADYLIKW